ncbi:hypothetical protein [Lysinibacillus sp. K60]|uniref:hypothetical protein n=1 Tax=Lysinibacillus sp. K60 TaxID=2720027 RepID=UPI001C8C87BE|nr:hypothetical protein [Lysinibacillus sp. K60]MBX8946814.1 hypothetical protein [Lysinibacillus sp. K60]
MKCQSLLTQQKQFIILDSSNMYTQLIPGELHRNRFVPNFVDEDFNEPFEEFYLVKYTISAYDFDKYTFICCNDINFKEIYSQPLTNTETWLGFYQALRDKQFERFTQKFETFQLLLLSSSNIVEGILSILYSNNAIENALLLDQHAYPLQAEIQRLILNNDYMDLRNKLRNEELIKQKQLYRKKKAQERRASRYDNPTLEDLASNFGDIEIDPDSIYDRD